MRCGDRVEYGAGYPPVTVRGSKMKRTPGLLPNTKFHCYQRRGVGLRLPKRQNGEFSYTFTLNSSSRKKKSKRTNLETTRR